MQRDDELVIRIDQKGNIYVEDTEDGIKSYKRIEPVTFISCVRSSIKMPGVSSGVLPQGTFSFSAGEDGTKKVFMEFPSRRCDITYELLEYNQFQRIRKEDYQAHEMHIGFSFEESRRASGKKQSKLFIKRYPLIEMKWERADSYKYILEVWGLATKASACTFCPFHTNYFFNYLKENDYKSYKEVVALDKLIEEKQKDTKIRSKLFVSRSVKRIEELLPEDCNDAQYFNYNGKQIWNGF